MGNGLVRGAAGVSPAVVGARRGAGRDRKGLDSRCRGAAKDPGPSGGFSA